MGQYRFIRGGRGDYGLMVCFLSAVYVKVIDLEWVSGSEVSGLTKGKYGKNSLGEYRTV